MLQTLISIIVPVYNVEKFLPKCIESIVNQTYTNFELILIDDGSTDNSGNICDLFAENDNRIKVIHQNNAGVSTARNNGIKEARGDYICFVDADDWIEEDYLAHFTAKIQEKDYDIIITGYFYDYVKTGEKKMYFLSAQDTNNKEGFVEIIPQMEENNLLGSVWSKLFKKDIIKNNNLSFEINISYSEDTIFCWNYLFFINSIALVDYVGYHYIKDDFSTLTKKMYPYEKIEEIACKMLVAKQKVTIKYGLQYDLKFIQKVNDYYLALMLWAAYSMYEKNYYKDRNFRLVKWKEYSEHKYMRIKPEESVFVKLIKKLLIHKQYLLVDILMKIRSRFLNIVFLFNN
jgi:glycosyltransferase involved in cell wall biosynthesis